MSFDQAIQAASGQIFRHVAEGRAMGSAFFRTEDAHYPMLGVNLHLGHVMKAMVNIGFAMNDTTMQSLLQHGPAWVSHIRAVTPRGPARPALELGMAQAGQEAFYAPRMSPPTAPASSREWIGEARQAAKASKRAKHGSHSHPADDKALAEAELMLDQGPRGKAVRNVKFGDDGGSLQASIGVRASKPSTGGSAVMEAYSNNFYAGYVNNGFEYGLVPVMRREKRDGSLAPFRNRVWTVLSIDWLGQYRLWGATNAIQGRGGTDEGERREGFAFSAMGDHDMLTPGQGMVGFAKRGDAEAKTKITATKHEPGVRFMERGTTKFIEKLIPSWRRDFEKIIRDGWGRGITWETMSNHRQAARGAGGRFTSFGEARGE